ncbi:MAG: TlpA family protein disulfide reductase [Lautropia sp.]
MIGRRAWITAAVLATATGAGLSWWRLRPRSLAAAQAAAALDAFHALTLPDPAGAPVALQSLRGTPIVLNFWASWCAPCVEEMPELSALATEIADMSGPVARTRFVGLAVDNAANVARFVATMKVSYPLVVGGAAALDIARAFGNAQGALPYTVVIDASGAVRDRILGRVDIGALRRVITS